MQITDLLTSPIGGNWIYWVNMAKSIGEFIRGNKLTPIVVGPVSAMAAPPAKALIDLGIRGGIRVAHLHFEDKIFLLNPDQWAKFSGNIIADSKAKLANVKNVSFEQAVLLGSVSQTLV